MLGVSRCYNAESFTAHWHIPSRPSFYWPLDMGAHSLLPSLPSVLVIQRL